MSTSLLRMLYLLSSLSLSFASLCYKNIIWCTWNQSLGIFFIRICRANPNHFSGSKFWKENPSPLPNANASDGFPISVGSKCLNAICIISRVALVCGVFYYTLSYMTGNLVIIPEDLAPRAEYLTVRRHISVVI